MVVFEDDLGDSSKLSVSLVIQAQTKTPGTYQDTCSSATSRMSHTGCPVLDGDSNGSSIKQATTPRNAADAIRTSGGIPSNTADIRSNKQDASHASQVPSS